MGSDTDDDESDDDWWEQQVGLSRRVDTAGTRAAGGGEAPESTAGRRLWKLANTFTYGESPLPSAQTGGGAPVGWWSEW